MSYTKGQLAILRNYDTTQIKNPARVEWIAWFMDLLAGKDYNDCLVQDIVNKSR